jgi:hypothetical protein
MILFKPVISAMAQRDVLTTVGISAGTVAFVRTVSLEAVTQAVILGATAVFVLIRALLEARKFVLAVRADNAARRARNEKQRKKRQRKNRRRNDDETTTE